MRLYALAALFFDESWNRHHSSIHSFVHSITRKNRLLAARKHKTHADRYARVDTCYCLTGSWWMTQGWKERGDEGACIKLCVWWLCVCVVCVSPSLPLLEVFLGSLFLLLREGRDGTGRFSLHSPRSALTLFFLLLLLCYIIRLLIDRPFFPSSNLTRQWHTLHESCDSRFLTATSTVEFIRAPLINSSRQSR